MQVMCAEHDGKDFIGRIDRLNTHLWVVVVFVTELHLTVQ